MNAYPNGKNDVSSAFVVCGTHLICKVGMLGAAVEATIRRLEVAGP